MKARFSVLLATAVAFALNPLRAENLDQIIARARAYLGTESSLRAVRSIHFSGALEATVSVPSPTDATKLVDQAVKLPADIIFQKEYQQRITITGPKVIEATALDGYDGWQKRSNPANPAQWQVTLLDAGQVKRLRANTWENLNFFVGLDKKGGTVKLVGDVTVDGVACVQVSFIHAENIIFHRYFDKATGRLVKTETEAGGEIREEGEMIVNGVRFPRKVINKGADGKSTVISFDKVVVNESIPAGDFAVPALQTN
ncbi:MAG: hypothetical protein JWQ83_2118 [Lacunisphaera sp.]|nr:hypothetical protein [Lacunisphaera sp.]MDB6166978.1 hypothetical protein [Lacunisphaera sp.]